MTQARATLYIAAGIAILGTQDTGHDIYTETFWVLADDATTAEMVQLSLLERLREMHPAPVDSAREAGSESAARYEVFPCAIDPKDVAQWYEGICTKSLQENAC